MPGTTTVRHCGICDGTVYNLSEMTEDEAEALLQEDANRCVVMHRRKGDGKLLNATTAPALNQPSRIAVASVAVAFGAAIAATAVVAALDHGAPTQETEVEVALGGIKINFKRRTAKQAKTRGKARRLDASRKHMRERRGVQSESKAIRRKRHRARKLTPRELLRESVKTEKRSKRTSAPRATSRREKSKP